MASVRGAISSIRAPTWSSREISRLATRKISSCGMAPSAKRCRRERQGAARATDRGGPWLGPLASEAQPWHSRPRWGKKTDVFGCSRARFAPSQRAPLPGWDLASEGRGGVRACRRGTRAR